MTDETLLISSAPPTRKRRRYSRWGEILETARSFPGEWQRVAQPMSKTNAAQVASDIRNAHSRDPEHRFTGVKEGERWESQWATVDGKHYLWLRLTEPADS